MHPSGLLVTPAGRARRAGRPGSQDCPESWLSGGCEGVWAQTEEGQGLGLRDAGVEKPPRGGASGKVGENLEGWCPGSQEKGELRSKDEGGADCFGSPVRPAALAVPELPVFALYIRVTMPAPKGCDEDKVTSVPGTQDTWLESSSQMGASVGESIQIIMKGNVKLYP